MCSSDLKTVDYSKRKRPEMPEIMSFDDAASVVCRGSRGIEILPAALEYAASEVESRFDVVIDVVAVGDTDDVDPASIEPLIAACREAMCNAAAHAGVERISVYAECRSDAIDVFVRDEGVGFDPDRVGRDRRGVAESIVGRMQRAGGTATIRSEPDVGTEVELTLPVAALEARR